jgi:tetratricopeptide (TPR) repeat protein
MARRPNQPPRKNTSANQRVGAGRGKLPAGSPPPPSKLLHQPDVRIDKAQHAWAARRFDEAIRLYESALARNPHNPVLLVDVARAYALRYRAADAERLIELAERLYPADAHLQQMLGRSYVQLQQLIARSRASSVRCRWPLNRRNFRRFCSNSRGCTNDFITCPMLDAARSKRSPQLRSWSAPAGNSP